MIAPGTERAMKIVFATDGSAGSTAAAEFMGANFAPDGSAPVLLVTVVERPSSDTRADETQDVGAGLPADGSPLRAATDVLRRHAFPTTATVLHGHPERSIPEFARAAAADLVVVGSRGLHGWRRLAAGSVSSGVARGSSVPVLVAGSSGRVGRVIVGYDGSDPSRAALRAAAGLPFAVKPEFVVCAAYEAAPPLASGMAPTMLAAAEEAYAAALEEAEHAAGLAAREGVDLLGDSGITASAVVGHGPPSDILLDLAAHDVPSLIAVGDRGRSRLERLVLGSTSSALLGAGRVDVLVVHAAAGAGRATP
jgi:nucleotide-binding universal stress UspA family protein